MSLLSYGSDPAGIKVEEGDTAVPVPSRPTNTKWKKLVLATAGTALGVGSAFAMYQGWSSYSESARIAAERASRPNGMFLESQYASEVRSDVSLLKSGQEVMLRIRGKDNLCMDDGGGWAAATSKFTNKPCNPSSPNQIFKYNAGIKEFESVYKTGLCIDDGGSWDAAGTRAHLWYCDPNNQNQWFVMDPSTLMLKNPVKNNLCFDDGGGWAADSTKYVMWYCDNNSPNQHFEVVSRAAMAEEKKAKVGTTMYDLLVSGKEIMLQVRGKNMCVDDGGSWWAATTKFVDMPCNPNSPNQAFKFNIKTGELESVAKPGLCIDDGGSWTAAGTRAHLWYCDINNQNQWFDMDESTLMLKNPVKDNLCLDDGGGQVAGATRFVMWNCDNNNPNQHFEVVLRETLLAEKQKTGPTPYDLLLSGEEIMFRVKGKKNLCVDDGGGWGAAVTKFVDMRCNPDSPNQVYKYDVRTMEFQNVNKPGLCIDDGGSWDPAGTTAHLWYCDANNQNQWYVLDESTLMLRNPMKEYLCFDDGGGTGPAATRFIMGHCDTNSANQHFEILSRAQMVEEKKKKVGVTPYDILESGQEIMLRVRGKNNLCVDDGGGWGAAVTKFVDQPCDADSPNQVFKYNVQTREFENVNKPGLCIDDGGSWSAAGTTAHLWYCDPNNQNQWFVLDEETLMLHNPMKSNLCFDDGGGTAAGATQFVMWYCDDNNPNQHFEIVLRSDVAEERRKQRLAAGIDDDLDLLNSGQKMMLRVRGKDNLCMDDGGGHWNGATKFNDQPCDPNSPNQIFTYEAKTHLFRSANKPNLCIDDGGAWNAAGSQAHLWDCDPNNQNQWFVLDEDTMMLRNPVKSNLCFDDGGGTRAGETKYVLWYCDNNSPNQHFDLLSHAKMLEEKKQRLIAAGLDDDVDLLNSGQPIMLRVRDKNNLCVDDGGGRWNGATKFVDQTCNPSSPNQLFSYDPTTRQFRSVSKPGLCMDDGGGWNAAETQAHLWDCDPNNQNQWFVWDENTMMLRNPAKNNLCFDDGGGMTPGASRYWLWGCDNSNPGQHFEVVSADRMMEEKKKARIASGTSAVDILATGQEILLRVHGKANLCVDDGGGHSNGETKFVDQPCNPDSPNQIFTYNSMTHQFASVNKPGMCMDDGGAWNAAGSQAQLWDCDPNNQNQWFIMDEDTLMLHNPAKENLCFDDGGGTAAGQTQYVMWFCSDDNPNQHFEVLPRAAMIQDKRETLIAAGLDDGAHLLYSGQHLMLRVRGKNSLCVDDGGGHLNGETKFIDQPCDPRSPNQIFTYDASTHQFRSVNKPGMCMDDGGGRSAAETTAQLWACDPNNENQWFILDEDNMMLRNPAKENLCFDDGGGSTPAETKFWLWGCDVNNANQHFDIVSPASIQVRGVPNPDRVGAKYLDRLKTGEQVLIRSHGKTNLCLDDGGGHSNGETKFVYQPCDPNSANQIFSYDPNTREFRSVNKEGLCLDDGGGWGAGDSTAHLWQCDAGNENQWLELDPDTLMLHNPAKPGLCFDDGGGQSTFILWYCNIDNPNQQFEILSRGELLGVGPMPPPPLVIEPGPWDTFDGADYFFPPGPVEIDQEPVEVGKNSANYQDRVVVAPPEGIVEAPPIPDIRLGWEEAPAGSFGPADGVNPDENELPDQEDANVPPPDVPVVPKADMPLANYGDGDWNLLAPSNDTISVVNADNSPAISAAEIFKFLQTLKNKADMEHEVMMYRYKRTYQCASAGLQTLAKDAVTEDEYHVLVQWMYDHCAAGATDVVPDANPSPPLTDDQVKADGVAPLIDDTAVKRQFMTKLDFYYEIKNHYTQQSEDMVGDAAVANLRAEETAELEKKLVACIEEAAERYGYNQGSTTGDSVDHLKDAIAWVDSTCMAS
ncbi:glycoside hydrolase 3 protein [Phytophthora pseudosyringae]|uniref:Glycoside hydrolase 3 protein n=1 Tax=Phytophthora pseudosyringae TaxID=221518 RepID=A0A8T1WFC5_9STRA|nr:glycoside hydrolase 3 protein [Phytophthora pseudosyringae]